MSLNDDRPPDAAAQLDNNTRAAGLADVVVIAASDPRARQAAACFRARFVLWRRDLEARIGRRTARDPLADVGFDRYLIGLIDLSLAGLDVGSEPPASAPANVVSLWRRRP